MVGKRKVQGDLFEVGNVFDLQLDSKSFYGQLAVVGSELFHDEEFAFLYNTQRGRPSVPPSQLALLLLMQNYEGLSDQAAIDHSAYDLRWAAVLRRPAGMPLCAKSTLQLFRAQLLIHQQGHLFLRRSLEEARRQGLLREHKLVAAVDTKPIFGRGAVEDTYNLLATGMRQLARAIAQEHGQSVTAYLQEEGYEALLAPSIKGSADIDWSDEAARLAFLNQEVTLARRLLQSAQGCFNQGGGAGVKAAAALLEQLLLQDVEEDPQDPQDSGGSGDLGSGSSGENRRIALKQGTAPGRIPSATDPEQRHGRKSKSKRFDGSKASVTVDTATGLVLAARVLPGDAGDATQLLAQVEEAEALSGCRIGQTLGDCAYGGGATREEFARAERILIAKVPSESSQDTFFLKSEFSIELPPEGQSLMEAVVKCPGGRQARLQGAGAQGVRALWGSACRECPLRGQCTASPKGRTLTLHPQEALLQAARVFQNTPAGKALLRQRIVVENGLARLARLGIGQARFIGRAKTGLQLVMAASVANLRRTWNWSQDQSRKARPELAGASA